MKNMRRFGCALGTLAIAGTTALRADVKLPAVLSSHMVLQREMAVPVWGTAAPNEKVTVKFRDQEKTAVADAKGAWLLKLDALKAGGPDTLTVTGTNTLTLEDVLVGEVWVGSGQSNMDMGVTSYTKGDEVLAKAMAAGPYPKLRLIRAGNPGWQEATPQAIEKFSALLFSFGLPLQQKLDVPVGLLVGAVGGTPSGLWLTEKMYKGDAACQDVVAKFAASYSFEDEMKKYDAALPTYEAAKKEWDAMTPEAQKGKRAPRPPNKPLHAGECGAIGMLFDGKIRPFIPFAMRGVLWDQGESGTAILGLDQYTLMGALIKGWRQTWGQGDFPFLYVQKPSGLGCAFDPADPVTRAAEKFVPLPATVPQDGASREMHIRIMQYPNTAMVISSDLGANTHPVNKSGYGLRACRVALGMVYGQKVEYYGPVYQSHQIDGGKVRVQFTHVGQGLVARPAEKLQGFALAGADGKFEWADAAIDGAAVVLSSDKVPQPVAVRYAWAQDQRWANLFNQDGLPAIPFRTDAPAK